MKEENSTDKRHCFRTCKRGNPRAYTLDLHEIIKQEAIAYAIWVDSHLWTRMSGKWWNDKPKGGKIILTDKKLYDKYFNNL